MNRIVLSLSALLAASAAFAQGPAQPTGSGPSQPAEKKRVEKAPPPEVTDQALERGRSQMDARFAARVGAIKGAADRRQAFQVRVEKEQFEFERHAAEERKAFYLYLKSVAMDQREKILRDFEEKQERDRLKFDKALLSEEKGWFDDEVEKNWRSRNLMAEAAPAAAASRGETAAAPAPVKVRPKAARKPKAAASKKRKSRVVQEQEAQAAADDGAPLARRAAAPPSAAPAPAPAPGDGRGAN